jgi:hypothetical protein
MFNSSRPVCRGPVKKNPGKCTHARACLPDPGAGVFFFKCLHKLRGKSTDPTPEMRDLQDTRSKKTSPKNIYIEEKNLNDHKLSGKLLTVIQGVSKWLGINSRANSLRKMWLKTSIKFFVKMSSFLKKIKK